MTGQGVIESLIADDGKNLVVNRIIVVRVVARTLCNREIIIIRPAERYFL